MGNINVYIINREKMSRFLMREIIKPFDVIFLSRSNSGKYILASDGDYYFILEEKTFDKQNNNGKYWFMNGKYISCNKSKYHFDKFAWNEEIGTVSLEHDFPHRGSFEIVYDDDLYVRTVYPFRKETRSLGCSKDIKPGEVFYRCSIQDFTLNFPLPEKIECLLAKDFKRTFEDGVFRFYERFQPEHNTCESFDTATGSNVTFGSIYNSQHLYEIICKAHGVDKKSNVKYNLYFSIDEDCALIMKTIEETKADEKIEIKQSNS